MENILIKEYVDDVENLDIKVSVSALDYIKCKYFYFQFYFRLLILVSVVNENRQVQILCLKSTVVHHCIWVRSNIKFI